MRIRALLKLPGILARKAAATMLRSVSEKQLAKGLVGLGNLAGRLMKVNTIERAFAKRLWQTANREEKEMLARILARVMKRKVR